MSGIMSLGNKIRGGLIVLFCSVSAWAQPVKVFILAGQSNMVGYGLAEASERHPFDKPQGSLKWLIDNPKTGPDFAHLLNTKGNYVQRDDVKIYYERTNSDIVSGDLAIGYGGYKKTEGLVIGPELGFGWEVGESLDGPVLLLKTAWGAQSLSGNFRPPSSGGTVGNRYTQMVKIVHKVLDDIGHYFPEYKGLHYELAGFAWHQGFSDLDSAMVIHYEENLTNLINDLRKEFKVPDLPFVIGESGFHGWDNPKWDNGRMLRKAQANICDSALHPEFAGQCSFVPSMPAYKPEYSGFNNASIHWFNSFFSYYTLGSDMGKSMAKLLVEPSPPSSATKTKKSSPRDTLLGPRDSKHQPTFSPSPISSTTSSGTPRKKQIPSSSLKNSRSSLRK